MPGPLRKETENEVLQTPLIENDPQMRLRPPASNSSDPTPADKTKPLDDGLFIRHGGFKRD